VPSVAPTAETLRRLRWRRRGAWMWPAFLAFTVGDALLVHFLPLSGASIAIVPAFLIAAFFNLLAVAVAAPMAGWVLRRRWRPDLPKTVAHDYAGTALLFVVAAALVVAGLLNRDAADEARADFTAQSAAVRRYVTAHAPPAFRRNLDHADTLKLDADLYRTCVPGPDPRRDLCFYVNTDQHPPGLRRDPSREPNESFARAGQYRP
jgi:hypothetical protein